MSDDKLNKWSKAELVIKKGRAATQEELKEAVSIPKEMIEKKPDGIIAQYKAKLVERKVVLAFLKDWYHAQLETAQYQLKRAVELKKMETDVDADRFLAELNRRHLQYLQELDFSNIDLRFAALEKLSEKTARMIEKLSTKDWPPSMIDETIKGIKDLQEKFFEKIMREYETTSPKKH